MIRGSPIGPLNIEMAYKCVSCLEICGEQVALWEPPCSMWVSRKLMGQGTEWAHWVVMIGGHELSVCEGLV